MPSQMDSIDLDEVCVVEISYVEKSWSKNGTPQFETKK